MPDPISRPQAGYSANLKIPILSKSIILPLLCITYTAYAFSLIFRSSFIILDGTRRFCLFDDAMISMRYAWNLSHGNGLTWNPGEQVEGFTNFLQTLFMTLVTGLFEREAAVVVVHLSGILVMLIVAFLSMRIAESVYRDEISTSGSLIPLLAFASPLLYYPLSYWTLMGMETGLLAGLLLAAVLAHLNAEQDGRKGTLVPIILGFAFWARPDALLYIILIMGYRLWSRRKTDGFTGTVIREFLILAAFGLGLTAFRLLYFGNILPNTFYLKITGIPLAFRLSNGLIYSRKFIPFVLPAFFISMACWVLFRRKITGLFLSIFIVASVYQVWTGGDAWPLWRFTAHVIPFLLLAMMEPVFRILRWNHGYPGRLAVFCLVTVCLLTLNLKFLPEAVGLDPVSQREWNRQNVNTSFALEVLCGPDASVAVMSAGAIPYFTGLKAYDILGKTDPYIARLRGAVDPEPSPGKYHYLPGHNKHDLNYSIVDLRPTFVQIFATPFSPNHEDVWYFAQDGYVFLPLRGTGFDKRGIYLLKDSPDVNWKLWKEISEKP